MRAGINGQIYVYDAGGEASLGNGIDWDAICESRQEGRTVKFVRSDGKVQWFEDGAEISEPDWVSQ
jgi:hypothetical protein